MGFFSWDCKGCNHSIREGHGWMGKAVVVGKDGSTARGEYDGYGRVTGSIGEVELADRNGHFALYHRRCFELVGRPEFRSASAMATDQGTPESDQYPEPKSMQDIEALREVAATKAREHHEKMKRIFGEVSHG